jgi:hypothetical protein
MGGFFAFQRLFSADLIRVLYIAEAIVITLSGIFLVSGMAKGLGVEIPINARIGGKLQGVLLMVLEIQSGESFAKDGLFYL